MYEFATWALRPFYDRFVRHKLPRKFGIYNGVVTRKFYLLDLKGSEHEPEYKQELVQCITENVKPGDTVVEIGSGYGVSTVWAARKTGPHGHVDGYEGGARQVDALREALKVNGEIHDQNLVERVDVNHAIVGKGIEIYGPADGATQIDPADLPDADVVVMDCEGTEIDILQSIGAKPRTFVVESHPEVGSPTSASKSAMESEGYTVSMTRKKKTKNGTKHILVGQK